MMRHEDDDDDAGPGRGQGRAGQGDRAEQRRIEDRIG